MFLAFGLVMEFPILLVGLSLVGIVTSQRLSSMRRMVILGIAIFSAVVTPGGDLVSPFVLGDHDVHPVRADDPVHPAQRAVTGDAEPRSASDAVTEPAVVIVSGLSGGGKTAAAKLFEDLGYTVVDNLPGELLPDLAELVSSDRQRFARVAIVLDVRTGDATLAMAAMRGALEGRGIRPRVVFLEASDDVLIRRFSETRHRHPLGDERGIASSIAEERRRLEAVRSDADVVLDTSDLSLRQLRERLFASLATDVRPDQLAFQLISFGFKHGVPLEADLVFDVRFMQNPYYVAELRQLSGPDRRGSRVRPRPARRAAVPRASWPSSSSSRSRPTSRRARPG